MNEDSVAQQLVELLKQLDTTRIASGHEHEKFRVALTGVLRLLSGNAATLKGLQGTPEELKGYILNLATKLGEESARQWESLKSQLELIISQIRGSPDRKS
ncbi:MAG: hypothetical protein ACFE8Z_01685 [Candidatus Hermodarchaeota archaeon]